jgi:hypothetical protein
MYMGFKGNETVNQAISTIFNPSNLVCISCDSENDIIGKNPIVPCSSDQNFVPTLVAKEGGCLNVVRVENPSLTELV